MFGGGGGGGPGGFDPLECVCSGEGGGPGGGGSRVEQIPFLQGIDKRIRAMFAAEVKSETLS